MSNKKNLRKFYGKSKRIFRNCQIRPRYGSDRLKSSGYFKTFDDYLNLDHVKIITDPQHSLLVKYGMPRIYRERSEENLPKVSKKKDFKT